MATIDDRKTLTPAHIRQVFEDYCRLVTEGDFSAVAKLYAEQATVEDPVGSDPHVGRDAIREFYKSSAGTVRLELSGSVRIAGVEGAAPMIANAGEGEGRLIIETLDVMKFDDDGLVASMRAFWGPENVRPA